MASRKVTCTAQLSKVTSRRDHCSRDDKPKPIVEVELTTTGQRYDDAMGGIDSVRNGTMAFTGSAAWLSVPFGSTIHVTFELPEDGNG